MAANEFQFSNAVFFKTRKHYIVIGFFTYFSYLYNPALHSYKYM